jgi:N6-adenosine-specific RNA methylase IME4
MSGFDRVHNQWKDENAGRMGSLARIKDENNPRSPVEGMVGARCIHPASWMVCQLPQARFGAILADPPWRFQNSTGKVAPEHRRLKRYSCLTVEEISSLPVWDISADPAHLYLWSPNAMLAEAMHVMKAWGYTYKTNIVWYKIRKDGGPDGRGVGFYFRNVTENLLFGVRGKNARTLAPGRRYVNLIATQKREHSRKPDEQYTLIEACSPGPWIELFARGRRDKWQSWGSEVDG